VQPPAAPPPPSSSSQSQLPDDYKNFDIVRAAQYGVLERCIELVDGGIDVNQPDAENVSILHWAAINNRLEIVRCDNNNNNNTFISVPPQGRNFRGGGGAGQVMSIIVYHCKPGEIGEILA